MGVGDARAWGVAANRGYRGYITAMGHGITGYVRYV